jgi:hypothetical protein
MKNDHEIDQERLQAYVDGQLSQSEKEQVDHHLKSCQECNSYVTGLMKLNKAIDDAECLPGMDAYFDTFASRVASRIAQRKLEKRKSPVQSILRWGGIPLAAAATLVIAVIVSLNYFSSDESPGRFKDTLKKEHPAAVDKMEALSPARAKKVTLSSQADREERSIPAESLRQIHEVTTIVIHLPGDDSSVSPPEIATALEINIPSGG